MGLDSGTWFSLSFLSIVTSHSYSKLCSNLRLNVPPLTSSPFTGNSNYWDRPRVPFSSCISRHIFCLTAPYLHQRLLPLLTPWGLTSYGGPDPLSSFLQTLLAFSLSHFYSFLLPTDRKKHSILGNQNHNTTWDPKTAIYHGIEYPSSKLKKTQHLKPPQLS